MKIAIITDTHFGARKGSKHLHEYFEKFYTDIFFPALEENKIDTVIHMIVTIKIQMKLTHQSCYYRIIQI